jgi:hypothetical protein
VVQSALVEQESAPEPLTSVQELLTQALCWEGLPGAAVETFTPNGSNFITAMPAPE